VGAPPQSPVGPMTATPTDSDLEHRQCPTCGSDRFVLVAEERIDRSKLDGFAFASRKRPEYMHFRLVLCQACDLVYASPAPTADALRRAYHEAAFDSAEESRFASSTYAAFLPAILERVPSTGGALDIGTGDGSFLLALQAAGIADVVGVEPSSAPVEAAAETVRPLIRQGPFRGADFAPGRCRRVTTLHTHEHLPEPLSVCREVHDLLSDGGAFFVISHNRTAPANRLLGRRSPIYDIEHLQLFTPRALRTLLERAGFRSVEVHPVVNRYPVRYWFRLLPLPGPLRSIGASALRSGLGAVALSLPVGNIAAIGYKPR
jgi:SAM-dependent methyltransferase